MFPTAWSDALIFLIMWTGRFPLWAAALPTRARSYSTSLGESPAPTIGAATRPSSGTGRCRGLRVHDTIVPASGHRVRTAEHPRGHGFRGDRLDGSGARLSCALSVSSRAYGVRKIGACSPPASPPD